jgi:predicted deacylase
VHRIAQSGLRNVLVHLGALKGRVVARGKRPILAQALNREDYILAPESGIFEIAIDLGSKMKKGQTIGYIHHLERPDRAPERIVAASGGYLITVRAPCLTQQGDCVAVIARQVSEREVLVA